MTEEENDNELNFTDNHFGDSEQVDGQVTGDDGIPMKSCNPISVESKTPTNQPSASDLPTTNSPSGEQTITFDDDDISLLSCLLVGCKGNGKSHTGNTILGQKVFKVTRKGGTQKTDGASTTHLTCGVRVRVTVVDTPGVSQEMTESEFEELVQAVKMVPEGFDAICLVWDYNNSEKNEEKEVQVFQSLHRLFGDGLYEHLVILVTHAQQEDIPEFIAGLPKVMKTPADQTVYIVAIENKPDGDSPGNKEQVDKLLSVIENTSGKYKESNLSPSCQINNGQKLNISIIGKTGVGKSHTGNTIIGKDFFEVADIASSKTTKCNFGYSKKDREIHVLDTPGVFSTDDHDVKKMTQELCKIVTLFGDEGLHALVVVISSRVRFTESETRAVNIFQHLFGRKFVNYAIILVTGKDNLRGMSESEFLSAPESLRAILEQCGNRYIFFNNTTRDETLKRQQLAKLIQKIDEIAKENGGPYIDDLFQEGKKYMEEILEETKRQHPTWSLIEQKLEAKRKAVEKDYFRVRLFKQIYQIFSTGYNALFGT